MIHLFKAKENAIQMDQYEKTLVWAYLKDLEDEFHHYAFDVMARLIHMELATLRDYYDVNDLLHLQSRLIFLSKEIISTKHNQHLAKTLIITTFNDIRCQKIL